MGALRKATTDDDDLDIISFPTRLRALECGACGVRFAMPETLYKSLLASKNTFYCPNGHGRVFRGLTFEQELERERSRIQSLSEALKEESNKRIEAEKRRVAIQGQLAKARKRAQAGVCQCCNRTFQNLARHMSSQHPHYGDGPQMVD
jgi:hypothetical protein